MMGTYYKDANGNSVCLQDNGLLLITPKGKSTRVLNTEEMISVMESREDKKTKRPD